MKTASVFLLVMVLTVFLQTGCGNSEGKGTLEASGTPGSEPLDFEQTGSEPSDFEPTGSEPLDSAEEPAYLTYREQFAEIELKYRVKDGTAQILGIANGEELDKSDYGLSIPEEIYDIPVTSIAEAAFKKEQLISWVQFPQSITEIEESAFEASGICVVEFSGSPVKIGRRAFADCTGLDLAVIWEAAEIGEEAFDNCDPDMRMLYRLEPEELPDQNTVYAYACRNGIEAVEIVTPKETEPIVAYPGEPLILTPKVGNFLFGYTEEVEDGSFDLFERNDNAPDFGFEDWLAPGCSTWCAVARYTNLVQASSVLASEDGRYAPENTVEEDRFHAWAEGAAGDGIGEFLTYEQVIDTGHDSNLDAFLCGYDSRVVDGYNRFSEICVVNGYARDQKTWEENGRVKTLLMYVEDKPYAYLELEDTIYPQYFTLPQGDIKTPNNVPIHFKFEIADVYKGTKYEDTCLTGILLDFTGRAAH